MFILKYPLIVKIYLNRIFHYIIKCPTSLEWWLLWLKLRGIVFSWVQYINIVVNVHAQFTLSEHSSWLRWKQNIVAAYLCVRSKSEFFFFFCNHKLSVLFSWSSLCLPHYVDSYVISLITFRNVILQHYV